MATSDAAQKLRFRTFAVANILRGLSSSYVHGSHLDLTKLLVPLHEAGCPVTEPLLEELVQEHPFSIIHGLPFASTAVLNSVLQLLGGRTFRRALDPFAAGGILLASLVESKLVDRGVGVMTNKTDWLLANVIAGDFPIEWINEGTKHWLDANNEKFDLVLSIPPFGMERQRRQYSAAQGSVEVQDEAGRLMMLDSLLHLSQDGVGVFITPSFDARSKPLGVYHQLPRCGLRADAIFALPEGPFQPMSSIPGVVAIIARGPAREVFVGRLSGDDERDSVLLANYRQRRNGPEVGLGRIVGVDDFKGIALLEAEERVKVQARRFGYSPIPLTSVTSAIYLSKSSEPFFEEKDNVVYLPLIGKSAAVVSQAEMTLKPHNYVQLVVKSESADPAYLAQFFSSSLGQTIRESLAAGFIPKITKASLTSAEVYLPPVTVQTKAVETQRRIRDIKSELHELELRVWSQPRKLDDIVRKVERFAREESFKDWLDSLPFPLASILWTYHTAGDDQKHRYEHLAHFFEALAEFMATLLLSAVSRDEELFAAEKLRIRKTLAGQHLTITKGTFGTWKCIYEQLAKTLRAMLAKPDSRERCQRLLVCRDDQVLDMVTSSELVTAIQRCNGYRNSWIGHTGVVGEREATERHRILLTELAGVRQAFGTAWDGFSLIMPKQSIFAAGIHKYTAQRVVGRCAPFEHCEVDLALPMEHGYLHLWGRDEREALKLLPLIRVMPSPSTAENACYFYSRQQRDGVRFVSYHFEQEADVVNHFPDTLAALEPLIATGTEGAEGEE